MFKSQYEEIMNKLNTIHDMCVAHDKRLSDIENDIEDMSEKINSDEDTKESNPIEVSELKADLRKNNDFIQNLLLMLVERKVEEVPNGKTNIKEAIRLRNASSHTVGPVGKLP